MRELMKCVGDYHSTKEVKALFSFITFVFLLWFVLQRGLLKCLKLKIGKIIISYAECDPEDRGATQNSHQLNDDMKPRLEKYFSPLIFQNKCIHWHCFLIFHEAGEDLSVSLFCWVIPGHNTLVKENVFTTVEKLTVVSNTTSHLVLT